MVLQSECESAIISDLLREKGIYNFSVSLFERLYRYNMAMNNQQSYDMLYCQGRMHPDIATFVNEKFYGGMLSVVPLPHQIEEQNHSYPSDCLGERLVATTRLCFIDSHSQHSLRLGKNNESEAQIVAYLSECLYRVYEQKGEFFDPELTLGIITPYRSQIALIRQRLEERGIEPLTRITVDTVERYQGGQRDVIFYSCCVNEPFQLANLVNAIEEDGNRIDRKLNVALTRARKQLFVTGVSSLLSEDAIYADLIRYLAENGCSTTYEELFS